MCKKVLCMLIAMLMIVSVLASCGTQGTVTEPAQAPGGNETAQAPQTPAEEPYELVMAYAMTVNRPSGFDRVFEALNEILIEEINVKLVDPIALGFSSYSEQMTLMLSGGDKLDTFCARSNDFPNFVSRGQLLELDDLLAQHGQGIVEAIGQDFLNAGIVDGSQYGLTTNRDLAHVYAFQFVKEYLDKYNVDVSSLTNMDDVGNLYATMKENEPNLELYAVSGDAAGNSLVYSLCKVDPLGDYFGVVENWGQDEDLKVVNFFEMPEYEQWCRYFRDWHEKGYILADAITATESNQERIRAGRAFSRSSAAKPGQDVEYSKNLGREMITAEMTDTITTTNIVQAWQWCIPRNCENPEAVMKFLNMMYTDERIVNLLVNGEENVDYVFTEDGHITFPEGIDATTVGYNTGLGWEFGNNFLCHIWEGDSLTLWDDMKAFNQRAIKSRAFGFVFNQDPVKTEVAAVTNVATEFRAGLENGILDPDTALPEFRERLKAAGIDVIIAEKQTQLDAWLAEQ